MKIFKHIVLIACLAPFLGLSSPIKQCNKANMKEAPNCYTVRISQLETIMKEKYSQFMQLSDDNEKSLLRNSQSAWLNYKNNYCQLIFQHYTKVSMDAAKLEKAQCISDLTLGQVKLLVNGVSQFNAPIKALRKSLKENK